MSAGVVLLAAAAITVQPVSAAFFATTSNGANSISAAASFPTYPTEVGNNSPRAYYRGEEATSSAASSTATDTSVNNRPGTYHGTTNGPATYWKLDENTGSTVGDSSGSANTGTVGGSATWATGRVGSAVSLNGTSQYVAGTRAAVNTSQAFTVAAWVYLTDNTLGRVAVSQSGSVASGFMIRYNRWGNQWEFNLSRANTDPATYDSSLSANGSAALNTWTHLAGVYDGAGNVTLYVNGVAQTPASHTSTWNATGALQVGRVWEWGSWAGAVDGWAPWAGRVDEVRAFRRALSAKEISSVANGLPVTDWQFSEGAGWQDVTRDRGPDPNNGTLGGNAGWTTSGRFGNAVTFNGSDSYVDGARAAVATNTSFSVAAWVYLTAKGTYRTAVSQDGTNISGFFLKYSSPSDRWVFQIHNSDSTGAGSVEALGTASPSLNTWYHLTGVYDSSAGQIKLYVDGNLQDTESFTSPWNATGKFAVGRARWTGNTDWWSGTIDSVKVYQRALAASEVTDLYNGVTYTEADMTGRIVGALQGAEQGQQSTTAIAFAGFGNGYSNASQANPTTFTIECWFRSASASGGLLVGFADTPTGLTYNYDRMIYLDSGGRLTFGTYPGSFLTVRSPAAYNDGAWHHVAGSLGAAGLKLYVDGDLVASDPTTTTAGNYTGYWRWGGGNLWYWPNRPSSGYLTGTIDEVAIYPSQLSDQDIAWHYHANH